MGRGAEEKLSIKRDKNHFLFGGTKILQHTPDKVVHVIDFLLPSLSSTDKYVLTNSILLLLFPLESELSFESP